MSSRSMKRRTSLRLCALALLMLLPTIGFAAPAPGIPDDLAKAIIMLDPGLGRGGPDGEPFLILGAESNNSSAWPVVLPKVGSAMEALHANTLEIPIYWEQFEPRPGEFDYSVVDPIIEGARERGLRLVLLWFSTWKNGSNQQLTSTNSRG